ncbi:DUF1223 domain-containing protein [Pseudomaricurvus alcaniphilus]|uniref:DUF1223 domain-containing protein n=1 Tax=Pseudomaricurvus alcaniphilus TaxID=1166482 RepID=UPI001409EB69|nr:DUF1223 domain-containing protein [Pseudomaricurvus alcaniphilus]NHN36624.1 DUF1223 domain-containing protein [Pseudomaricurvus alcaniphilus]
MIKRLVARFALSMVCGLLLAPHGAAEYQPSGTESPVVAASGDAALLTFESGPERVALLELFSSQGCSSCPPAEQWVSTLLEDPRLWQQVVPVVFHVDYWDHLGWKDPYASIKFSQRQRRYQLHGYCQAVYTPGFVLAGQEWQQWFQERRLPELVPAAAGNLVATVNEGEIDARFIRAEDNDGLRLNAALLGFDINTRVQAGENRGRQLAQNFVVMAHQSWRSDDGVWQVTMPALLRPGQGQVEDEVQDERARLARGAAASGVVGSYQGRRALALWVSYGGDPKPLQATGGWLDQ